MPFIAGQYLEWTLPEGKGMDAKGNRRYFTIASSPTERDIRLGVKLGTPLSAFKRELMALRPGDTISAAQLAGDFTLPHDASRKLAFIAGGIGITPFRSMIGAMLAGDRRDAMLLYSNRAAEDVAYYGFLEDARERIGLKTLYALTNDTRTFAGAHQGLIDAELIKREIPDYRERTFYISGPRAMVVAFKKNLSDLGVSPLHIKTDYFPGFV
jgi:ferredoxin-NADP reductase